MKYSLFFSLFLLFAGAAQAQQTADDIITKHIAAMGGDNWKKIQSIQMEAKVTTPTAPGMEIPLSMTFIRDKAARVDVTVMGMTQSSAINGDKGWANNPFMGKNEPEPLTADQVKEMHEMTDIDGALNGYKEKGYTVELVGKEDVEGTEAYKLKIIMGANRTQYSLIDPQTYYEIKNITVTTVDGKEVSSESIMSNYKEVDGVLMPHTIEQNNPMMGNSVTTVTTIKINPTIDEAIFNMPGK